MLKQITELQTKMQRLRDALIEIHATAWAFKGNAKLIPQSVDEKLAEVEAKAEKVLKEYKKALDTIAEKLIEVETLEQDEYEKIIIVFGIKPKKLDIIAEK